MQKRSPPAGNVCPMMWHSTVTSPASSFSVGLDPMLSTTLTGRKAGRQDGRGREAGRQGGKEDEANPVLARMHTHTHACADGILTLSPRPSPQIIDPKQSARARTHLTWRTPVCWCTLSACCAPPYHRQRAARQFGTAQHGTQPDQQQQTRQQAAVRDPELHTAADRQAAIDSKTRA